MAIYKPGPGGSFRGKLGGMVISKWKHLLVGRSAPGKATKKPSAAQEDSRLRFSLVNKFLSVNKIPIDIGFQSAGRKMTPSNYATRYHMSRIIIGEYPDYSLDYSKITITQPNSSNQINNGHIVATDMSSSGMLSLSWKGSEFANNCTEDDDMVYLVFYQKAGQRSLFMERVARRDALTAEVTLPAVYLENEVHGYMFFLSYNRKLVSRTHYLGAFFK